MREYHTVSAAVAGEDATSVPDAACVTPLLDAASALCIDNVQPQHLWRGGQYRVKVDPSGRRHTARHAPDTIQIRGVGTRRDAFQSIVIGPAVRLCCVW
jgi:hypothetical protein